MLGSRCRTGGRRCAQGLGRVADEDAEGPDGAPAGARKRHGGARRGAVAARVSERRQAGGDCRGRDPVLRGQPPLLRRSCTQPRGEVSRGVRRGLHVDRPPGAARHRRWDHALELPADDGRLEARPGARRWQRPDPQACGADAVDDAPLLRAGAGRAPAGRRPGTHRRRRPCGRFARQASRYPARVPDRRRRDGEDHRPQRRGQREARPPRARRQGADGRARRRRPRDGRGGDQGRRLLELRPGLHRLVTHSRARSVSTTTSSPSR